MFFLPALRRPSRLKMTNIACILTLLLTVFSSSVTQARGKNVSSEYGRRLEVEMQLSGEELAKLAAFKPPAENLRALSPNQALTATTENWVGERLNASKDNGPYTMVVTITGKAKADGDAITLWNSGWFFGDQGARTTSFPGLTKLNVKAGERVEMTKAAQPTRFKESRAIQPMLELVKAENLEFESIKVQIWSGVGENSWRDILMAFRWLIGGIVFVALRWWWVKR
ncbi:hypothetical protein [Undibacterium sp. Ji22W]|uniref:hypothetical protein n=1 Tax=Undibacterium sp. Ji22W TaxID=3413038 RepID=UPI003BEF83DB